MKPIRTFPVLFLGVVLLWSVAFVHLVESQSAVEAAVGFDNQTNGFVRQHRFEGDKKKFDEREEVSDGLGPVYNAQAVLLQPK